MDKLFNFSRPPFFHLCNGHNNSILIGSYREAYALDNMENALNALNALFIYPQQPSEVNNFYYLHFTNKEMEALAGQVTCYHLTSGEKGLNPGSPA